MKDFERVSSEEGNLRRERMEYERNMALIKHDLKEVGTRLQSV